MSGSIALRKILFASSDAYDQRLRGYHFAGAYEPQLSPLVVPQPAAVAPRSGFGVSAVCLTSCVLGCLTMKSRNKEKWWFGLFMMCGVYYNALKSHKVGNGLVGHQSGFFAAGMGVLGCACRLVVHSGSARHNRRLLAIFLALMWYEVGRYHLWAEHAGEVRREVTPERSFDLLGEYVPQGLQIEFLPYRPVTAY